MEVEDSNKLEETKELERKAKAEEMKELERKAKEYKLELEAKLRHLKSLEDENAILKLRYEADQKNLQNDAVVILEYNQHLASMKSLESKQENEITLLREEVICMKKKLQEKIAQSTFYANHDPKLGLHHRKPTITKRNGTRSLMKAHKISSSDEKKKKSNVTPKNVTPKTSPAANNYYPAVHDDGQEYLWNGEDLNAIGNAAMNGIKNVTDAAISYVPLSFLTETSKKGRMEGFQELMNLDALQDDETFDSKRSWNLDVVEDDDTFDSIAFD
jgi:hypothetical protein